MAHHTDFDNIVFVYDHLKKLVFGKTLDEAQAALIPYIPSQAKVLIIGGGTGQIIIDILDRKAVEKITFVELSAKMIQAAKEKVKGRNIGHVFFLQRIADLLDSQATFDVVITPFVLDLYRDHELLELMQPLDELLAPQGKWLFCDFQIRTKSKWTKLWQHCLIAAMYSFFRLTSKLKANRLPNYEYAFQKLGYKYIASHTFYSDLIHSQVLMKVG